jgi:aryl-alcohol dehydrogenase-like predicted oxidoreductase
MAEVTGIEMRGLGSVGPLVSAVGLGCNNFGGRLDQAATTTVVHAALDAGITLFDTADIYGGHLSEVFLGEALAGRRDDVILATKFGMDMHGANGDDSAGRGRREYVRRACESSLQRLQTDRIDLYQYHEPDGTTPLAETLGALDELVAEGKVLSVGISNVNVTEIEEASVLAHQEDWSPVVSVQNEYNLLNRHPEADVLPLCEALGIGVLPYFPLASGLLSGKYRQGRDVPQGTRLSGRDVIASDEQFAQIEALAEFAEKRGLSMLEVAIGSLLAQPAVSSVIAGATSADQVQANARAGRWRPTAEDLAEIDAIVPPPPPPTEIEL